MRPFIACIFLFLHGSGFTQEIDSLWEEFSGQEVESHPRYRECLGSEFVIYHLSNDDQTFHDFLQHMDEKREGGKNCQLDGIYHLLLARSYERDNSMDLALQEYDVAITHLESCQGNEGLLSSARARAGFVLVNTGLYQERRTFDLIWSALDPARKSNHVLNQFKVLDYLGDYYRYGYVEENLDSALYYYDMTLELLQQGPGWGAPLCNVLGGLSNVWRSLGDSKKSQEYENQALEYCAACDNYQMLWAIRHDLAWDLREAGDTLGALKKELEGLPYAKKGDLTFLIRAHEFLYETYADVGDYKKALHHYQELMSGQDSMSFRKTEQQLSALEAKYQANVKDQRITELENKALRQTRNSVVILSGLGLILLGLLAYGYVRLRQNYRDLQSKNKEITLAQLRGQNIERRRMAFELHDNLNTKIAAIRWQLEVLQSSVSGKPAKILDKTLSVVNDVYADVRLISHNLVPETVEAMGLIPSITGLLEKLNEGEKTDFHFESTLSADQGFGEITYHLYNIVFEMINNILKHAEADNAWISLYQHEEKVYVNISDDGVGFDIDQKMDGYGLRNITSRLENINGKWSVESAPGKGTKYNIEVPLIN